VRVPAGTAVCGAPRRCLKILSCGSFFNQEAGKRGIKATDEEINTATKQVLRNTAPSANLKHAGMTGSSPDDFAASL